MAQRSSVAIGAGARRAALAAGLLALGCNHTEPFSSRPYGSDAPFDASPPIRLTYNLAADRRPSWLADASGVLYSTQQLDRGDEDVCLGLLPAGGGTLRQLWCGGASESQQLDAIESAVLSPQGQLGFVSATSSTGGPNPARQDLAVAPSLDPASARRVQSFPNLPHNGVASQTSAEHLRWLDELRLAYVDQVFHVRRPCRGCEPDTLRIGKSVTLLYLNPTGSERFPLPGTEQATGVALAPSGDAILWTRAGDSRVYRRNLVTGVEDVLHDFGQPQFVRDIHVGGNRMAAIVGGRVAHGLDPELGLMQWDSGGTIHVLDLSSRTDLVLDPEGRVYRRPALSPDGSRLVAEGYTVSETGGSPIVARGGDLYLFGAP